MSKTPAYRSVSEQRRASGATLLSDQLCARLVISSDLLLAGHNATKLQRNVDDQASAGSRFNVRRMTSKVSEFWEKRRKRNSDRRTTHSFRSYIVGHKRPSLVKRRARTACKLHSLPAGDRRFRGPALS